MLAECLYYKEEEMSDEIKQDNHPDQSIAIVITTKDESVNVDFGRNVSWISFTRSGAISFAQKLLKHARDIG